jgi:oligopeptide/dipeptide ABC transporter ATP-binding protein
MTGQLIVDARDLSKQYRLRGSGRIVRAVDGVSLRIGRQSTFGLVGESGCGKSTLGRLLLRLEDPTGGSVSFDGQDWLRLRGEPLRKARKDIQAIFQDPFGSLDPRRTAAQAIGEALRAHGQYREGRVTELLGLVGLTRDTGSKYPGELSGGQRQRVTIARAIGVQPKFIVCDEAVSALDVSVQAQIINLLSDLKDSLGVSYLFISHSLATVRHIADHVGVMYLGKLVETAPAARIFATPAHPYTAALLAAAPVPDPEAARQRQLSGRLSGEVTSATVLPTGCRFRLRCPRAAEICAREEPPLLSLDGNHEVACHFPVTGIGQAAPSFSLLSRSIWKALEDQVTVDDIDRETFAADWTRWRRDHEAHLADPHGFLAITGLHWLTAEPERFDDAPGAWSADGDGVSVTLDDTEELIVDGATVRGTYRFAPIAERGSVSAQSGDAVIEVARRGGYDIIRPRHPEHPLRTSFHGISAYPPDPHWVVSGRYLPYRQPRDVTVGSVVDGLKHVYSAPGMVEFTLKGYSLRLTAFNGRAPGSLHILFTDATSGLTTYQASRSLSVAAPGPDGTVTLDFNRAANLPCAYTEFATCPLPPPENRLPVAVEAGELIYQNDLWLDTYGTE